MKEYIERVTALNALIRALGYCQCANDVITRIPAADVAEVRHGRWVDKTDISRAAVEQRVDCSVCGQIFWTMSALLFNYCPNCGARMDEEADHETS